MIRRRDDYVNCADLYIVRDVRMRNCDAPCVYVCNNNTKDVLDRSCFILSFFRAVVLCFCEWAYVWGNAPLFHLFCRSSVTIAIILYIIISIYNIFIGFF